MKTVYNIIIADDHKMFVDGLRSILEQEDDLHIVHTTSTGEEVLKYLKINQKWIWKSLNSMKEKMIVRRANLRIYI